MASSHYSLELEKQFLSGTLLWPETRAETTAIQPADLSTTNRVVLSAIDACIASGTAFSVFLLVDRLNSLGIKIADTLEPGIYVKNLQGLAVGEKAVVGIAKQLKTISIHRKLVETGQRLAGLKLADKDKQKKASELIAEATEIFNAQVNLLGGSTEDEPQDLYKTMDGFIDQETHYDTRSVPTPFSIYNDLWGWLDSGDLSVYAARAKTGKSTWLMSMLHQIAEADGDKQQFRALILDTELTREEVQSRLLSSMTGIKEFYIRHKIYRKNRAMVAKVEAARKLLEPLWGHVDHIFVGGVSLEQQATIARRWAHKHIIRTGKRGLIGVDYLKLNGSDFATAAKISRDIIVGKQADTWKNLAKELHIPIVALIQAGRENEDSKSGTKIENGGVIADSDMVARFGSNIYILQKLSPDERAFLQQEHQGGATHSLKILYPRQLGPNEHGHDCLVRYTAMGPHGKPVTRYTQNYVLYSFDCFCVREIGTFKDIVGRLKTTVPVQETTPEAPQPAPAL